MKIPPIHLLPKLQDVSTFMAKWGKTFFNKFREKVRRQKKIIADLVNRVDAVGVESYLNEVERLNDLLFQEETYWKQRAKLFWLEEGVDNTRFFHATATSRKKTNHISYLKNDAGVQVDNHEGMCQIITYYYPTIFKASPEVRMEEGVSKARILRELTQEISFEELYKYYPRLSLWAGWVEPAFFQHFWESM